MSFIMRPIHVLLTTILVKLTKSNIPLESRVVNGEHVPITNFAHSAFLMVNEPGGSYVCGASIVNQRILLTAAHCLETCGKKCADAAVYAGHANKRAGHKIPVLSTKIHEDYKRNKLNNDIGLILVEKQFVFSKYIMRVALMKKPPLGPIAFLAGWGLVDEVHHVHTDYLHFIKQKLWTREQCQRMIANLPEGTLCAGDVENEKYASEGDSGSALVINDYIQIGIVSYKRPDVSVAIVVYTDVSYFHSWIKANSRNMYCEYEKNKK